MVQMYIGNYIHMYILFIYTFVLVAHIYQSEFYICESLHLLKK